MFRHMRHDTYGLAGKAGRMIIISPAGPRFDMVGALRT